MIDRTPEVQIGFRCKFPNNCDCCPPNKKSFDFILAGLRVVERRRDDLKEENARLRNTVEDLKRELDVWKQNYEIAKSAFLAVREEA